MARETLRRLLTGALLTALAQASLALTPYLAGTQQGAGGVAIVGAGLRVGVKSDGNVSYMNPEYWYRAYLRGSFDEAQPVVRAAQERLAKAYEVLMPQSRLAVIGVALNDPEQGEAWWAGKIGPDHVATLPYEIYIVDGKVSALFARYRIALSWPALGMGQFMGIVRAPDAIRTTMGRPAGVAGP